MKCHQFLFFLSLFLAVLFFSFSFTNISFATNYRDMAQYYAEQYGQELNEEYDWSSVDSDSDSKSSGGFFDLSGIKDIITKALENVLDLMLAGIINLFIALVDFLKNFVTGIFNTLFSIDSSSLVDYGLHMENSNSFFNSFYESLYKVLQSIALSIVVILSLKKGFMTYILWRDGSPDENPVEIIFRVALCVAMILTFKDVYDVLFPIVENGIRLVLSNIENMTIDFRSSIAVTNIPSFETLVKDDGFLKETQKAFANLIGAIFSLIVLFYFIKYSIIALFHILQNGIEFLFVRAAFPIISLGLLSVNGGSFSGYCIQIVKNSISIAINIVFLKLSYMMVSNLHFTIDENNIVNFMFGILLAKMASGSNAIISQLLGNAGSSVASGDGALATGNAIKGGFDSAVNIFKPKG